MSDEKQDDATPRTTEGGFTDGEPAGPYGGGGSGGQERVDEEYRGNEQLTQQQPERFEHGQRGEGQHEGSPPPAVEGASQEGEHPPPAGSEGAPADGENE